MAMITHQGVQFDTEATSVDANGCTGLTTLPDLPNARTVDARGCTGLGATALYKTEQDAACADLDEYQKPGGEMERFLTGGGRSMAEILAAGSWDCHDCKNCPTHAAYGVTSVDDLPPGQQKPALKFIALFDARVLRTPVVS